MTPMTTTRPEPTMPHRRAELLPGIVELMEHHRRHCPEYARILAATGHGPGRHYAALSDVPWLPVRLFKNHVLRSVAADAVSSVLTSSGTTGTPSRIHLDAPAARAHQRALLNTLRPVLGARRLPMLVVDSAAQARRGATRSARAAGVLGLMNAGRDHTFVLDGDDRLDVTALRGFLSRHGGEPFLVFGFTYLVWTRLIQPAQEAGLDLSGGILLHSGGWKRLAGQAVDAAAFREAAARAGLSRSHDFYGMVEQIGVVHVEGDEPGLLSPPEGAEVIIRDPVTWEEARPGETGLIQVLSTLPRSYPGHSLLTEDLGVAHRVDSRTRFTVLGRLPRAEARGCSDAGVAS
ncbi:acyl-protein synthetase [Saccharomonospora xinjiangensis]|uniref:LuxE/PaaK family acyltransferase n=1 Tax=Saccharomonospora xinjiangensis TaxID=75294 RepID=UPI0010C573C4|nr:acyl-protein synthetase [Saccharomonospora xinjiangensis]QBQ60734.1 Acyl-protein synthetase, LuxE [Saccharomonospora xinjiangensis]